MTALPLTAGTASFRELNEKIDLAIKEADTVAVHEIFGQRYIGRGLEKGKTLELYGTPGNDLGIYMAGGHINVYGNGQDAAGNTMGGGRIVIHGSVGDALGYAMLDGSIYVEGNVGFRCGIHIKEYKEKSPTIVIGGKSGAFLGEYMAGGRVILLGLGITDSAKIGRYCATGMHGGVIYIRGTIDKSCISSTVSVDQCTAADISAITPYINSFCEYFGKDPDVILNESFVKIYPSSARPYAKIYTNN